MGDITNPWVGATDRSYIQIKQAIIAKKNDPVLGIPELTDDSESNDFIKEIGIWSGLTDLLQYYIDNRARETFLNPAKRFESAVKISREWDYRIKGLAAATGALKFFIDDPAPSDIVIPVGTVVETADGISFVTITAGSILTAQTEVTVEGKQWIPVAESVQGQSDGSINQIFNIGAGIADDSISVTVNISDVYTPQDTFGFSKAADEHFVASINELQTMDVKFGDDINGKIPPNAQNVSIGWATTLGAGGNAAANQITETPVAVPAPPGVTVMVNNDDDFTGGADAEGLTQLKRNVPLSLRTLYRAVTDRDYIDVTELALGVAKAGVDFECGKTIDVFIAPEGGGIASQTLLDDTGDYLDVRKMNTTFINMFAAGEVAFIIEWNVVAFKNFLNSEVQSDVETELLDFFDISNQEISGSVFVGDLYQLIEGVTSVDHSTLVSMKTVPYARPLATAVPQLVWTRALKDVAIFAEYKIVFTTTTAFKLLRNNVFMGNFISGNLVDTVDLTFTITGSYTAGDSWEFKTYPVNVDVVLDEASLPVTDIAKLTINVSGGL